MTKQALKTSLARCAAALSLMVAAGLPGTALAQADADAWKWRGTIYLWGAGLDGTANLPAGGSASVSASFDDLLKSLDFAIMGVLEARKGRWGGLVDLIYMDLSNSQSGTRSLGFTGPGGNVTIPVDASLDVNTGLESTILSLAATYTLVEKPNYETALVGGARYLDVKTDLSWQATGNIGPLPPVARSGNASVTLRNWDAVIGVRGRADLDANSKWYMPYYADIGTGDSDRTWQALAGVGYRFGWGEVTLVYRYLDYKFKSGEALRDLTISGPALGASWRW
ncbi:MAG TPA: hypothetical protein VLA41_09295 [Burkholderiales bacterium]|nr:hypothetical protein [Burkholderiales bacterium]